jgi:two-component system, LytTR family, sensor histidine kinase AlgZ
MGCRMRADGVAFARIACDIFHESPRLSDSIEHPFASLPSGVVARSVEQAAQTQPSGSMFDVCHGALAWRALLLVNASLALTVFATSTKVADGLAVAGPLVMAGLVGTVAWLTGICAMRRVLERMPPLAWRAAMWCWGGLLGALGSALIAGLSFVDLTALSVLKGALVGFAFAIALAFWIEQRAKVLRPSHAHARLAELQARMRPHFLFNTLNTATSLVRVDPPAAEAILEDLSDLFRAALDEARTATLGGELAIARQYLAIEQRRFGERMTVHWEIDAAADVAPVPSLVLQPLLENAVFHGVETLRTGAWIRVRTRATRDRASIEIENNLGAERASPERAGSGMALANVRERLRLLHDLDGRFDARREGDRFVVRIGVPLK